MYFNDEVLNRVPANGMNLRRGNFSSAGSIFEYLQSTGSDSTADVLIYCRNGVLSTHRLVLASISKMLLCLFKEDTWDEPIALMLVDFAVEEVANYLKDFYKFGFQFERFIPLNNILGVQGFSNMNHEDLEKISHLNLRENNTSIAETTFVNVKENETLNLKTEDFSDVGYTYNEDNQENYETLETLELKLEVELDEIQNVELNKKSKAPETEVKDNPYFTSTDLSYVVKCSLCNTTVLKKGISTHLKRKHNIKMKDKRKANHIKDEIKEKKDNRFSEARNYFEIDEETKYPTCKICAAQFHCTSTKTMNGHLRSKHPEVYLSVTKKHNGSKMSPELQKYCEEIPENPSKRLCKLCNSKITYSNIKRHIKNKHGIFLNEYTEFVCSQCGKVFNNKWNRDNHEAEVHQLIGKNKSFKFTCTECGRGFQKKNQYDDHMNRHTGEKPHQCPDCGTQFGSSQSYYQHFKKKSCQLENGVTIASFKCQTCGKEFESLQKIKLHYLHSSTCSHDNMKKPFPCQHCEKSFTSEKYLEIHTRSHTGEKPYQCELCSRRFSLLTRLKYHKCVNDEKPLSDSSINKNSNIA